MDIDKIVQDDRQAQLTVSYTAKEFEGFKRRAARKIAKDTKIPGFRPGKAPYNVILNRFGEGAILQEAIDILLEDDYGKMIDQSDIEPSGSGELKSIESYDPPKLVFMVPLEPIVDLGDYRNIRKEYVDEPFDDKLVEEFIINLRRKSATLIPAEHPAEEGNLVYFTLSGKFTGVDDDEDAVITDKTPQQVIIPTKEEKSESEWPFSGFARKLLGVKAGDTKEIQHTYKKNDPEESYRGKTAVFKVEVQSIKELELPELDETFIQTMGDYDSVESFRQSVAEELEQDHHTRIESQFFDELIEAITEGSTMTYPPQMLAHELEHVRENVESRLKEQNLNFETYLKILEKDEATFVEEELQPTARKRLERSLIMDALIKGENLQIDQDKLKEQITQVMTEIYYSGDAQELQNEMGQDGFTRMISMEAAQRVLREQLFDRLKLIASGQPIPQTDEAAEKSDSEEDQKDETDLDPESGLDDSLTANLEEVAEEHNPPADEAMVTKDSEEEK